MSQSKRLIFFISILAGIFIFITGCTKEKIIKEKASVDYVKSELDKLVPVEVEYDLSQLSDKEQKVIAKLVQAGKLIDELFLLQVDPDNLKIREELQESEEQNGKHYLKMFNIMFGSWNRLDENHPFLNNEPKPKGAGYYPEDLTKKEFQQFVKNNPDKEEILTSHFTLVRRQGDELQAIPYHEAYRDRVKKISKLLKEAAQITEDPTLKTYLKLRAKGFLTDDYYDSDMAWMDLNGNLEVVIGPYEVYEDQLFSYKAAYEAFICAVDQKASQQLAEVGNYLNSMEDNLPIPDEHKNFGRGSESPIKVVQEIFSAGDTKAGVQTIAFNLPNDERVREAKGSKKVMLKNVIRAKFDKILKPIAAKVVGDKELDQVTFDSYFNHILMHEVNHGLGPGQITLEDGTETTVSDELKELYPTVEECKADILGMYNLLYLMDQGVFEKNVFSAYATYLGGMFRSIRFGIGEAHGGGIAIQFNYLVDKGAIYQGDDGKLHVNSDKMEDVIKDLSHKVLMIQAKGDYQAAKQLVDKYVKITPLIEEYINKLRELPVDIDPEFPAAKEALSVK
ncbi:MAG: peptidase [Candidatus Marinimicrobia bacterium]|nr:peptidase [Candidatus Neomarinimicrobiota bacterium]